MVLGSWARVRSYRNRCKIEAERLPHFKNIIYNGISKTVYGGRVLSCKPDCELQFLILVKNQFQSFSCVDIILCSFGFYFETEMKTAIFKVILPDFVERKYLSTGDFSVNNRCTPLLSISQTEFIFMRNILECQNNPEGPSVLKLQ